MKRVWLPGWQMNETSFDTLKAQLGAENEEQLSFQNEQGTVDSWLQKCSRQITEPTQLVGWSLGGALAYQLASRNKWVQNCLLINTNVQFSGENGLEPDVAEGFMARYEANPEATRKRFALLVDQARGKEVSSYLCLGKQLNTLQWLYDFNAENFKVDVPCHVLLSAQDQLVPIEKASKAWEALPVASLTKINAQHSAPLFAEADTINWIQSHE
ncbi:hypothetical protein QWZ13_18310 [Reinekea marina]|uniref:Alpha/beta fold hydrolase n=1 Tax=Reinekea marina TaxID=1310421 RepID=A0ABV7WVN3_9GAMM|nr:alpha/beta fold hydrolase [Reinekea marina]MDN3650865.1 hypothetical protein [Reinekea marina]